MLKKTNTFSQKIREILVDIYKKCDILYFVKLYYKYL